MSDDKGKITSTEEFQIILFELGNSLYGIPIEKVSEIIKIEEIAVLPKAPQYIEGVLNLRGNVVPIIDLRKRFGMPQVERTKKSKIIVLLVGKRLFGVIVDTVHEVLALSKDNIEPSLPTASGLKADFIDSIGKHGDKLIIILDITKIVQSKESIKLEE